MGRRGYMYYVFYVRMYVLIHSYTGYTLSFCLPVLLYVKVSDSCTVGEHAARLPSR